MRRNEVFMKGHMGQPAELVDETELSPFLEKLEKLFLSMNEKYDEAASHYGFHCNGCEDNCCMTLFHHHTYLEFFFLKMGFKKLISDLQNQVCLRAEQVCRQQSLSETNNVKARTMCPANIDGKCAVYYHRPMICRLHGIPSQWSISDKTGASRTFMSSGCEEFDRQCGKKEYYQFDRTPFYRQMAQLESRFKERFGFKQKIKKTVAEIIVCEKPF